MPNGMSESLDTVGRCGVGGSTREGALYPIPSKHSAARLSAFKMVAKQYKGLLIRLAPGSIR